MVAGSRFPPPNDSVHLPPIAVLLLLLLGWPHQQATGDATNCEAALEVDFEVPVRFPPPIWNYVAVADEVLYTLGNEGFIVEAFNLTRRTAQWATNISSLFGLPALSIVPTRSVVLVNLGVAFAALRPADGRVMWVQTLSLLWGTQAFMAGNAVFAMVTVDLSYVGLQGFALPDGTPVGAPVCVSSFSVADGVLFQNLCEYRSDNLTFTPTALQAVDLASGDVLWSLPGVAAINGSFLNAAPLIRASSSRYIAVANVTAAEGGETVVIIDRFRGTVRRTLTNFSGFASLSSLRPPRFVAGGDVFVALLSQAGNPEYVAVDLKTAAVPQTRIGQPDCTISGNSTVEVDSSLTLKIRSIVDGSHLSVPNATDVYAPAVVDLGTGFVLVEAWRGFRIFDTSSALCVAAADLHPAFEQYTTGITLWNGTVVVLARTALYGARVGRP